MGDFSLLLFFRCCFNGQCLFYCLNCKRFLYAFLFISCVIEFHESFPFLLHHSFFLFILLVHFHFFHFPFASFSFSLLSLLPPHFTPFILPFLFPLCNTFPLPVFLFFSIFPFSITFLTFLICSSYFFPFPLYTSHNIYLFILRHSFFLYGFTHFCSALGNYSTAFSLFLVFPFLLCLFHDCIFFSQFP